MHVTLAKRTAKQAIADFGFSGLFIQFEQGAVPYQHTVLHTLYTQAQTLTEAIAAISRATRALASSIDPKGGDATNSMNFVLVNIRHTAGASVGPSGRSRKRFVCKVT
jgi:hypothetical protein